MPVCKRSKAWLSVARTATRCFSFGSCIVKLLGPDRAVRFASWYRQTVCFVDLVFFVIYFVYSLSVVWFAGSLYTPLYSSSHVPLYTTCLSTTHYVSHRLPSRLSHHLSLSLLLRLSLGAFLQTRVRYFVQWLCRTSRCPPEAADGVLLLSVVRHRRPSVRRRSPRDRLHPYVGLSRPSSSHAFRPLRYDLLENIRFIRCWIFLWHLIPQSMTVWDKMRIVWQLLPPLLPPFPLSQPTPPFKPPPRQHALPPSRPPPPLPPLILAWTWERERDNY